MEKSTKIPLKLLEYLIRECVSEILDNSLQETTNGAPAPPAEGQGTADTPALPDRENPYELNELQKVIEAMVKDALTNE